MSGHILHSVGVPIWCTDRKGNRMNPYVIDPSVSYGVLADGVSALARRILRIFAGLSSLPHTLPRTKKKPHLATGLPVILAAPFSAVRAHQRSQRASVILARRQHPPADPRAPLAEPHRGQSSPRPASRLLSGNEQAPGQPCGDVCGEPARPRHGPPLRRRAISRRYSLNTAALRALRVSIACSISRSSESISASRLSRASPNRTARRNSAGAGRRTTTPVTAAGPARRSRHPRVPSAPLEPPRRAEPRWRA
jgi:hypothetical protein